MARICEAVKADGSPCRATATSDAARFDVRFCSFHQSAEVKAAIGLGGVQPGSGRPPKLTRARVEKVLQEAMDPAQPTTIRVRAINTWLAYCRAERARLRPKPGMERDELEMKRDELAKMPKDELMVRLANVFGRLTEMGELPDPRDPTSAMPEQLATLAATGGEGVLRAAFDGQLHGELVNGTAELVEVVSGSVAEHEPAYS